MTDRCFYFGCWNRPGHCLVEPGGKRVPGGFQAEHGIVRFSGDRHLDASLAPKKNQRTGVIACAAFAKDRDEYHRMQYFEECPQGQYVLHHLSNGFTAVQWWDRNQGDKRGACNSTILLEGKHTAEEMIAALHEHFPHVAANLAKAGVELVRVTVTE